MILAVDSGANLGWALFEGQTLVECGLTRTTGDLHALAVRLTTRGITRLVIERPHAGRTRAPARDILTLAVRAGEAGGVLNYLLGVTPEYIEPGKWKGQLKKDISNRRTEAKLTPPEKSLLSKIKPLSAKHNVTDAVGIGLFAVGR
jgi:hypothetical protein